MSDFEVCPVGTLQRLAQVEADLRSMRRCFEVTELERSKYKAERDSMREILDHIPQVEAELAETSDKLHAVEAERDALRAALLEVVRVFDSAPSSICDTVWVTGDSPETLYDHCRAALARVNGGGNG